VAHRPEHPAHRFAALHIEFDRTTTFLVGTLSMIAGVLVTTPGTRRFDESR
jgi:hypothetical protein